MAVRPLVYYPDPRLKLEAEPISEFGPALAELVQDLVDTMHAAPAVGITGPHIGVLKRVVVLKLAEDDGAKAYVNPIIMAQSGSITATEGSVSMPGATQSITRAEHLTVRYQDITGAWVEETASGFRAVCHQHEIDQLNGIFWLERLSRLKRDRLLARWRKTS